MSSQRIQSGKVAGRTHVAVNTHTHRTRTYTRTHTHALTDGYVLTPYGTSSLVCGLSTKDLQTETPFETSPPPLRSAQVYLVLCQTFEATHLCDADQVTFDVKHSTIGCNVKF